MKRPKKNKKNNPYFLTSVAVGAGVKKIWEIELEFCILFRKNQLYYNLKHDSKFYVPKNYRFSFLKTANFFQTNKIPFLF